MGNPIVRILLVEDDEDDYVIARDLLSEIPGTRFDLEWVATFEAALDTIGRQEHDVYLVDYHLGEHSGLELLREAVAKGYRAPIIILTGQGEREVDVAAMQAGAADFLVKGRIDAQLLERAIRYALENARLLNALSELAIRDELTGLYNRRELNRLLAEEANRSQRFGRPTALVMLDIDHFKVVNDTYGHQVGDEVLRWIGQMLREHVRSVDRPARYGGEEFTIILPETPGDEAFAVAERLRQGVAAHPFTLSQDDGPALRIPITISLGVAELPSDADVEEALIEMADQALYEAKRRGRNCTVQYRAIRAQDEAVS